MSSFLTASGSYPEAKPALFSNNNSLFTTSKKACHSGQADSQRSPSATEGGLVAQETVKTGKVRTYVLSCYPMRRCAPKRGGRIHWNEWPDVTGMSGRMRWNTHGVKVSILSKIKAGT